MAELGGITISVGVNISVETVQRCCQILQMYLQDNPDKVVRCAQCGEYPSVWIDQKRSEDENE